MTQSQSSVEDACKNCPLDAKSRIDEANEIIDKADRLSERELNRRGRYNAKIMEQIKKLLKENKLRQRKSNVDPTYLDKDIAPNLYNAVKKALAHLEQMKKYRPSIASRTGTFRTRKYVDWIGAGSPVGPEYEKLFEKDVIKPRELGGYVYVVMDTSGSMVNRAWDVYLFANTLLKALSNENDFKTRILAYGNRVGFLDKSFMEQLRLEAKNKFRGSEQESIFGGTTPGHIALRLILNDIRKNRNKGISGKFIILGFTDGDWDANGASDTTQLRSQLRSMGVRDFWVIIGKGEKTLYRHGKFVPSVLVKDFDDVSGHIGNKLTKFIITLGEEKYMGR